MSMLAERRRKQRVSLNPRGKLWTEDTNSFGQKMLKKMGWKNGKGLGANEDGNTEPLRVSHKSDNKGMGYQETEQWTAHDDNFSRLLENLNGNKDKSDNNSIKVNSLETKGQHSKARINYHKFTKAKDLSRYSEKDLANIFGKKTLKQEAVNEKISGIKGETAKTDVVLETNNGFLLNKGSMTDYFKKKKPKFSMPYSEYTIGNNGVLTIEKSDSENERPAFGFAKENDDYAAVGNNGELTVEKSDSENERPAFGFSKSNNIDSCNNTTKKKKRKYAETFFSYLGKNSENTEEMEDVEKKKSKKNKSNDILVFESKEDIVEDKIMKDGDEVILKTKKSNRITGSFVSYVYEDEESKNIEIVENQQDAELKNIFKQKKKKVKNQLNGDTTGDCQSNENSFEIVNSKNSDQNCQKNLNDETCKEKKSKKSKRKGKENISDEIKVENMEHCNEERLSSDDSKVKYKQNDTSIEYYKGKREEVSCEVEIAESNKKQKKCKKRKNEKNEDVGVTNIAFCDFKENDEINASNGGIACNFEESVCDKQTKTEFRNCAEVSNDTYVGEDNEVSMSKKKSKKSKSRRSILEKNELEKDGVAEQMTENNNKLIPQNGSNQQMNEYSEEVELRKKIKKEKKAKKRQNEECDNFGISNPGFSNVYQEGYENEDVLNEEIPKKNKKKRKSEKISDAGVDNPVFNNNVDDLNATLNEQPSNPYEIKVKKKKISDEDTNKLTNVGLDNPALNLNNSVPDTDLILNIVSTPTILKKTEINSSSKRIKPARRKSVRFSEVLQERVIPNDPSERTSEYISNRNELFDINTSIIEDGLREEMKKQGMTYQRNDSPLKLNLNDPKEVNRKVVESSVKEELNRCLNCGFVNNGFDIRSVDKVNFYENKYEVKSSNSKGIDNEGFNKTKTREENVESISNTIEKYQAEVENNINEAKIDKNLVERSNLDYWMVGDVGTQIDRNIKVAEGSKLCFKEMHFKTRIPHYLLNTVNRSKKTYRHLIRGDITVAFKNSNLYDIKGYAVQDTQNVRIP